MQQIEFRLDVGDRNAGTIYLPDGYVDKMPVLVYCHGWGGSRKLWPPMDKLCETAIENNIALVTFDFFGCGETGGDYSQMTYKRWRDNLSDVLDFVCTQAFADTKKIGCYGFSSGSTAVLRLAATDERISFIISVGTCISAQIGMLSGGTAKLLVDNMEGLMSGGTANIFGIDFGIEFYKDTISNAPVHTLKDIKCPVLFLQGTADNPYRIADARTGYLVMKGNNLPATHIEIEGGTHGLDNVADEAVQNVLGWIEENICCIRP